MSKTTYELLQEKAKERNNKVTSKVTQPQDVKNKPSKSPKKPSEKDKDKEKRNVKVTVDVTEEFKKLKEEIKELRERINKIQIPEIKKSIEVHLEDIQISNNELWEIIKEENSGALLNWLTYSDSSSGVCKRFHVMSELSNYINELLSKKLIQIKEGNKN